MSSDLDSFLLGALLNLASALVIVRLIYYRWTQNRSYVFSFLAFNVTIYFVMSLLTSSTLTIGVGFGLFAIFSVIRYRTEEIPIREMTYLFVIIALPVMNSLLSDGGDADKILIANGVIIALLFVLEREWGFEFDVSKRLTYEKVALIVPSRNEELLADLRERTGLPVKRAEVGRIDFLRDTAELTVFYDRPTTGRKGRQEGLVSESQPFGRRLLDPD